MANFVGGNDNDTFSGDAENDTATGNAGADALNGGAGNDVLYSAMATGDYNRPYYGNPYTAPELDHGAEVDTLSGGDGYDTLSAGYGDNVDGGSGDDLLLISFQGATTGVYFDASLTSQVIGGGTIQNIENIAWTEGSDYNDTLVSGGGFGNFDPVFGMGGDDSLVSGYYTGNLYGGDGNDTLDGRGSPYGFLQYGGAGDDVYLGGAQMIEAAGEGIDTIVSLYSFTLGENFENLTLTGYYTADGTGNGLDNILTGNDADNHLLGADGNDSLTGGSGNDWLEGGAGNDTISGGTDNGDGETSGDTAIYSGNRADYLISENADTHLVTIVDLRGGSPDGTDTLDHTVELLQFGDGVLTLAAAISGVAPIPDTFVGDGGNDSYGGNAHDNTAIGNAGDDTLGGKFGNDTLEGGAGADVLDGGTGEDLLYSAAPLGNYQTPYYYIPYVTPVLDRSGEVDSVTGGEGNDVISAGYGDNVDGGDGFDTLFISFQGASAGVTFDAGLTSQTIGGATIQNMESVAWIEGSNFDDAITDAFWGASTPLFGMGGNDSLVAGYNTSALYGGDGNDVVDGRNSQYLQRVDGGAGADTLYTNSNTFGVADGGAGNDLIYAHGQVNGGTGNDTIVMNFSYYGGEVHGDSGNDNITASSSGSTLFGDAGNDILRGGDGYDVLNGGAGNDTITGGAPSGPDPYYGGPAGDVAVYSGKSTDYKLTVYPATHLVTIMDMRPGSPDGTDRLDHTIELLRFSDGTYLLDNVIAGIGLGVSNLVGGDGNDIFVGSEDANTAQGNGGNDTLSGNGGDDTLSGGDGSDTLDGGTGTDQIYSAGPLGDYQTPYYDNSYLAPQLDRGAEGDSLRGGAGDDRISAGYGDNVDGGDGNDMLFISFQGATSGVTFDLTETSQTVGGATIANIESAGWIEGSEFDDTIIDGGGSPYGNFEPIFGMGGNDSLVAGYYTGWLDGGIGNDVVDGRNSQYLQRVVGGEGNDTLYTNSNTFGSAYGGDGNDVIYAHGQTSGGAGDDTIVMSFTYYGQAVHGDDGNDDISAPSMGYPYPMDEILYGDAGDDILRGGDGNDALEGGSGNDTITGGADNGVNPYYGGLAADVAIFSGKSTDYHLVVDDVTHLITMTDMRDGSPDGTDVLDHTIELLRFSDGTYLLDNVIAGVGLGVTDLVGGDDNDLFVGSEDANSAAGNGGDDSLNGNGGNDTLNGGAGSDVLDGGTDADVLYSAVATGYFERPYYGNPYTAPAMDHGTEIDTLRGGSGDDLISAGYGDNVDGGSGQDTLVISFQGASSGVKFDMTLSSQVIGGGTIQNVESAAWIEGSEYNDTITDGFSSPYVAFGPIFGMGGNDSLVSGYYTGNLYGGDGNDTLDSRGGAYGFVSYGGAGNDVYYAGGQMIEAADEGTDTVISQSNFTLGENFENLTLTGNWATDGTGNQLGNLITGNGLDNYLTGLEGNDRLVGGIGNDTLVGGTGNDTFFIDTAGDMIVEQSGEGTDLVYSYISYTLGDNVERLALAGKAALDGTGNALDNIITGNALANHLTGLDGNDRLDGGAGNDTMAGGSGNDTYVWTDGDVLVEQPGEGTDTIIAGSNFALTANFENLTLTGTALLGSGTDADNILTGNDQNNILKGFGGNDRLIGGLGKDALFGGTGNDSYWVEAGDQIRELAGEGTDVVYASTSYRLATGQELETLILSGSASNGATGNELNNRLQGNSGDNRLDGGLGNDTLYGGHGADTFIFLQGSGADYISDFRASEGDRIHLRDYSHSVANGGGITLKQVGGDTIIDMGGGNTITVHHAIVADVSSHIIW